MKSKAEGSKRERSKMEREKGVLKERKEFSELVSKLVVLPHRPHFESSFYEDFALRGIRVDRIESELVVCSFKVPPRLTDESGNLAPGALANLVDVVGASVIYLEGSSMSFSVNISISYVSTAKVDDELEVTSKLVGRTGLISGTVISVRNKATGETIAEGRHTLFSKPASKI